MTNDVEHESQYTVYATWTFPLHQRTLLRCQDTGGVPVARLAALLPMKQTMYHSSVAVSRYARQRVLYSMCCKPCMSCMQIDHADTVVVQPQPSGSQSNHAALQPEGTTGIRVFSTGVLREGEVQAKQCLQTVAASYRAWTCPSLI